METEKLISQHKNSIEELKKNIDCCHNTIIMLKKQILNHEIEIEKLLKNEILIIEY